MSDEYRLRKDIDKLKEQINRLDLSSYSPSESAKIMDKFDRDLDTLDTDLVTFSNTLINLKGNLVAFNQELIDFDEDNENLAEDLSKLKDNLHSFTSATQKLSTDLGDLDTALNQLDDDVFGEEGLDFQLTNLTAVLGDNNSGLIKSMNTLQTTVGDANSGLVKKANDTASSLNQLSGDVSGLGTSVTGLVNTVGDNNSGLVKGLNDLSAGLESLEDDVFGQNGLESSVNGLSSAIGDNNSGLTKELNDLDSYTKDFYDDVYGTNGLNTQLSALEGVINNPTTGLSAQINGLDNRVFGTGGLNDSIFGTNGLASRIGTAEGGLSNLTGSLDTLVDFLTNFEGTLDDFEEALEEDEDIDTSQLNSSITSLLTLIAGVKKDIDVVDGNLTDVSDSFDGVKTNLYGTKTITVDGQNVTVPKEPTDTADATSLRGHLKTLKDETVPAVQDTLYGGEGNSPSNPSADSLMGKTNEVKADLYGTTNGVPNDPSTASNTSFKTTIEHLRDETVPTVQGVANQAKTSASTIKGDLYGTKTVDGQTVPREPNEASSTSFKTTVTTLRDTTVPAVQGEIFGTDSQGKPLNSNSYSDDSLLGRADAVQEDIYGDGNTKQGVIADLGDLTGTITDEGGLIDQLEDVGDGVTAVKGTLFGSGENNSPTNPAENSVMGKTNAIKSDLYGTKTVDGQTVPKDKTDTPDANSVRGLMKTITEDDIPTVKNITYGEGEYYIDERTHERVYYDEENPSPTSSLGLAQIVDAGLTTANGHITNIQNMSYGADQIDPDTGLPYTANKPSPDSIGGLANSAIQQIGDRNTGGILYDIDQVQTDIGEVNAITDGSLQDQITYLPSYIDRIYVSNSSTYSDGANLSQLSAPASKYVIVHFSELGKKVLRDNGQLNFTLYITAPDNTTSQYIINLHSTNVVSSYAYQYNFSSNGHYVIACEHLKYSLMVGEFCPKINTGAAFTFLNAENYSTGSTIALEPLQSERVCLFGGMGKLTASTNSGSTIGIMSIVSPLPKRQIYFPFTGDNKAMGYISISTTGDVTLRNLSGSTMNSGDIFVFHGSYTY